MSQLATIVWDAVKTYKPKFAKYGAFVKQQNDPRIENMKTRMAQIKAGAEAGNTILAKEYQDLQTRLRNVGDINQDYQTRENAMQFGDTERRIGEERLGRALLTDDNDYLLKTYGFKTVKQPDGKWAIVDKNGKVGMKVSDRGKLAAAIDIKYKKKPDMLDKAELTPAGAGLSFPERVFLKNLDAKNKSNLQSNSMSGVQAQIVKKTLGDIKYPDGKNANLDLNVTNVSDSKNRY